METTVQVSLLLDSTYNIITSHSVVSLVYCIVDINECLNETCSDVNAECVNNVGSYSCQCKQGYTGDGDNCTSMLIT